jgi:hypothetical protein
MCKIFWNLSTRMVFVYAIVELMVFPAKLLAADCEYHCGVSNNWTDRGGVGCYHYQYGDCNSGQSTRCDLLINCDADPCEEVSSDGQDIFVCESCSIGCTFDPREDESIMCTDPVEVDDVPSTVDTFLMLCFTIGG